MGETFRKKVDEDWKAGAQRERAEQTARREGEEQHDDEESDQVFMQLLASLIAQAQMALGLVEHPATRRREFDAEQAKYLIDVLRALDRKTRATQTLHEKTFFTKAVPELKMLFVQLSAGTPAKAPGPEKADKPQGFGGD